MPAKEGSDPREDFITAKDGDFWLKGRKWYSVAINFWPLYSAAAERSDFWGTWQKNGYYSPNLVRKDLENFRRLGGNTISNQYGGNGCGRNVRDLYRICRELGIYVNQSLAAAPLGRDVPRLGATDELTLAVPTTGVPKIGFRLEAAGRFRFGEKKTWARH